MGEARCSGQSIRIFNVNRFFSILTLNPIKGFNTSRSPFKGSDDLTADDMKLDYPVSDVVDFMQSHRVDPESACKMTEVAPISQAGTESMPTN